MLDKPVKITLDIKSISFKNKERRSDVEEKQCLGTKSFIMHIAAQNSCVCRVRFFEVVSTLCQYFWRRIIYFHLIIIITVGQDIDLQLIIYRVG